MLELTDRDRPCGFRIGNEFLLRGFAEVLHDFGTSLLAVGQFGFFEAVDIKELW